MLPLILCYHKIERRLELGVTRLSPRRFRRQIERFARSGWKALTLEQLQAIARGQREAEPSQFVVTFDDAYRGLREHAFPVLREHGFPAICSVITDYAGRLNRWDVAYGGRRFAHLTWRDIRRWSRENITFISHTATHPRLTWLPEDAVAAEMARSRDALAAELGETPTVISYPFGAAGDREFQLAREAGYSLGFGLAGSWSGDPMHITRLPVYPWALPMPGVGMLAPVERLGAWAANRCSVGTTVLRGVDGSRLAPLSVGQD